MAGPSADIRFICTAHTRGVPVVTLHQGQWAYCPGGDVAASPGHVWIAIPAVRLSELKGRRVGAISERLAI